MGFSTPGQGSNVLGVVGACVLSNASNVRGVTGLGERDGNFWLKGEEQRSAAEGDNPP